MTDTETKTRIIAAVTADVREYVNAAADEPLGRYCPVWAAMTLRHLNRHGIRAVLQAGSACFPMVSRANDDGTQPTHFSFMWRDDNPINALADALGFMPEMHVWCGIPETGEIVDGTTKYLPASVQVNGFTWRNAPPPAYVWHHARNMPDGYTYIPAMGATQRANRMAEIIQEMAAI